MVAMGIALMIGNLSPVIDWSMRTALGLVQVG